MKILRVMGLGLAIVMLKFLVPRLFGGFENALLSFFEALQSVFGSVAKTSQAGILPALK